MTAHHRRPSRLGQVVALADILANGVVIIMILILLSIKVQSDKAQEEINQTADITTILSRDMAKSIIFNDLPSSPPAVLHDYHSCLIPHDCNPSLFPILEVYDDSVRLYNENVRMTLNEMLKKPNPMDLWLKSMTAEEKYNLRMDIYGVGAYYLSLAILEENGIRHPRHWHFLAQTGGDGEGVDSEEFIAQFVDDATVGHSDSSSPSNSYSEDLGSLEDEGLENPLSSEAMSDLTLIEGGSFSELSQSGLLPQQGENSGEKSQSELSEQEIKSRMRSGKFSSIGLKLPNSPLQSGESPDSIPGISSRELMIFLSLVYMHYGYELDGLRVPYLQQTLSDLIKRPRRIKNNSNFQYVDPVSELIDETLDTDTQWAENFHRGSNSNPARVGLQGRSADFITNYTLLSSLDKEVKTDRLTLLLRPWPSAWSGERTEITDSIVLAHPRHLERDSEGLEWLPLAFLSPVGEQLNINLGFVQAEIKNGEIFIEAEANQIWTSSGPVRSARFKNEVNPVERRLFYIYIAASLCAVMMIAWLLRGVWRKRWSARQI